MTAKTTIGGITLALAMTATACGDGRDTPAETTRPASETARDAGRAAGDAVRGVGDAVGNAGRAADAAVETMDVKAALMGDRRVDASDINVDTNHETRTVVLKGRVPTAEQRGVAEQIAIEQAKGYRIQNDLTVGR